MVFPEGTRSKTGGLLKGQSGLAHLAITTGTLVVPIALSGSENLQNPMKVFKPTAILRLKIGRPFVAKNASLRPTREMASEITTEIMIRIAQLLPEDQRGAYSNLIDIKPTQTVTI
jgi:1-acyl-sn-glycerol-3-phosphate acyltransferase